MGTFFDKFLEFKNEAEGTKRFALIALAIITISLAMLSICGAWAVSEARGDILAQILAFIPRLFYACLVLGLELFAAVLFVRALIASHWVQSAICGGMLLFLAWANVQNAKDGVHFIMPTRFAESGQTLNAMADLAREEASTLGEVQTAAIAGSGAELERVRKEIADLKVEQQIMASASPEGISKAQRLLLAQGLYFGSVDGIAEVKTESAMRARGEAIQREMTTLKAREDGLMQGQASPVQQATTDKRKEEIATRAEAREAESAAWRLEVILWVAEIARSLGLWAAVTSVSRAGTSRLRKLEEEIEVAKLEKQLAEARGQIVPPAPVPAPVMAAAAPQEPVQEPPPIEPLVTPPPVEERSDASQRARNAGKANAHMNKADQLESVILVNDNRARRALVEVAPVAAE